VFAPRLRAARDRGLDLVLRKVLPSGSLGPDLDDPAALHRVPLCLAATGHSAAARRVLDRVARRYLTDEGDVRASPSLRSANVDCAESSTRMASLLALGALRAGCFPLATRLDAWLQRAARAGGGVSIPGPRAGESVTDFAATLHVGAVDLALGRGPAVSAHAHWLAALWAAQPHPDALLLRRDVAGSLVTLWPAGSATCHAIHALGPGSGHGLLGEALAWLSQAALVAPRELTEAIVRTAQGLLAFSQRAEAHARRPEDQAALAWGAAEFARVARDLRVGDHHDAADLAVRLALRVCESWRPDGGFGPDRGDEALTRVDRVAWVSLCLHETLAALDAVEPLHDPAAAPGWRLVLCNVPEVKAQEIADVVVAERLAACVNAINPVRSTYVWRSKVERDSEVTLAFKTTADRVAALTARVLALHPYELPEVISLAVEAAEGHAPYLDWVRSQVTPEPDAPTMPPAS
jgi:periplasmic divalent cation tolerance protein